MLIEALVGCGLNSLFHSTTVSLCTLLFRVVAHETNKIIGVQGTVQAIAVEAERIKMKIPLEWGVDKRLKQSPGGECLG